METVYDRVKRVVVDKLSVKDPTTVQEGSSFIEDLNADSLDLVEMIMALEEEFAVDGQRMEISDEEAGNIHTVRDAVTYLEGRGVKDEEEVTT